jgi:hypothetical protein
MKYQPIILNGWSKLGRNLQDEFHVMPWLLLSRHTNETQEPEVIRTSLSQE